MLKKIYLKNFKSFGEAIIDFSNTQGKPKKCVAIYGENGSGKSNFISALSFIKKTIQTLSFQEKLQEMFRNESIENYDLTYISNIFNTNSSLIGLIKDNKTINSIENMELEFEFFINNKTYIYKIIFDDKSIIEEKLCAPIEKNITNIYHISYNSIKFNPKLFSNKEFQRYIEEKIKKYFGKHTFLSIILYEMKNSNIDYISDIISISLIDFLNELTDFSLIIKNQSNEKIYHAYCEDLLNNLTIGKIKLSDKPKLIKTEKALKYFFTSLYSDIKDIYYEEEIKDEYINYNLFFKKLINKEIISVPYELESTGTKKLITLFPLFFNFMKGSMVIIDEIDTGIHDLLFEFIINKLLPTAKGQLIFTSHNTLLLRNLKPEYTYVININAKGQKEILSIKDFERIQGHNNPFKRYINGIYGGIPIPSYFDFDDIISEVSNIDE